jgi:hypothetical protein
MLKSGEIRYAGLYNIVTMANITSVTGLTKLDKERRELVALVYNATLMVRPTRSETKANAVEDGRRKTEPRREVPIRRRHRHNRCKTGETHRENLAKRALCLAGDDGAGSQI